MQGNRFAIVVVSFAIGVFVRSFLYVSFSVALTILLIAAALVLYTILVAPRASAALFVVPLALVASVGGVARYELSEPQTLALTEFVGERISAEGIISKEIDERETLSFLTIDLEKVSARNQGFSVSDRIRVSVDRFESYSYGDRIKLSGVLQEPENFETDTGRIFDYRSYLAKDGIYFEIFRPKIEIILHGERNPIVAVLLQFKSKFLYSIEKVVPEPESALLGGLLLGEKHSLGDKLTEDFRRSGLVHVIVLSGYNMTIVAYAIMWLLSRFPPALAGGAGAVGILAFTLMAGSSATAGRAAIMALLVILAKFLHRDYDIRRALAFAAFIMIVHNPKILAFDPSFQLSFLATLGLIYLSPHFERWFKRLTERFGIRQIVAATFATQIFVLPRLIELSGTISLVGLVSNILVLPLIPITMLFGALAGVLGFVHTSLAIPVAFIAYALLHYEINLVSFFGSVPFAALSVPALSIWFVVASYALLFFLVNRLNRRRERSSPNTGRLLR